MNELRKDPLSGRWVAILDYSLPPDAYNTRDAGDKGKDSCSFCSGREAETPLELAAIRPDGSPPNTPGWSSRVLPHPKPILLKGTELGRRGVGMYDKMNSIGHNDLIIETPSHNVPPEDLGPGHMAALLSLYRDRMLEMEKDATARHVFIYKNSGRGSGALYSHPHSEIVATPVIPKMMKEELDGAKDYYRYKERCIFCDILDEERRSGLRLIGESEHFVAFCPFAQKYPFEFWIMPIQHSCAFQDISDEETGDLGEFLCLVIKKMRKTLNNPPFNYVLHSAPNRMPRKDHWHTLGNDFHWHIELSPRLLSTSGFERGSDFYLLTTSPEDAARYIKEVS